MFLPRGFTSSKHRTRAAEKIKRQVKCLDSWILWIISAWHSYSLFPFVGSFFSFLPSPHLINMSQKMMFSLFSSLYRLLWECKLDTEARGVGLLELICHFGCFCNSFQMTQSHERKNERQLKWIKVCEEYCTFSFLFWTPFLFGKIQRQNSGIAQTERQIERTDCLAAWHGDCLLLFVKWHVGGWDKLSQA